MVHGVLWGTADVQKEWVEKEPGAPGDGLVLVSKDLVGKERVGRVVGRKKWRETVAKEQQSTHSLCMNLLDIISYHIISYLAPPPWSDGSPPMGMALSFSA